MQKTCITRKTMLYKQKSLNQTLDHGLIKLLSCNQVQSRNMTELHRIEKKAKNNFEKGFFNA